MSYFDIDIDIGLILWYRYDKLISFQFEISISIYISFDSEPTIISIDD